MRMFLVIAIFLLAMTTLDFNGAEGTNILLDPSLMCKKTRRLRGKMAEICRHDSGLLKEIINGISLGFRECEFQFRYRRWNCTPLRRSMRKILMKDTRENGFLNAITSAGITYTITRACTMGNLMECSCEKAHSRRNEFPAELIYANTDLGRKKSTILDAWKDRNSTKGQQGDEQSSTAAQRKTIGGRITKLLRNVKFPEGEWEWGGCSDNIQFGFRQSRIFLDAKSRRRSDLRNLVRKHNNHAGRLTIRDNTRFECKCHGLSGSCTVKTCWLKMPPFREVSTRLRNKFDSAYKVVLRNDGNSFMPDSDLIKPPSKYDLVYTEDSPDFCSPNSRTGSLGTQDRICNSTSGEVDGCELLCCNRGYKHRIVSELVNCNCVFKWCCEVICEKCLERREINTCL